MTRANMVVVRMPKDLLRIAAGVAEIIPQKSFDIKLRLIMYANRVSCISYEFDLEVTVRRIRCWPVWTCQCFATTVHLWN